MESARKRLRPLRGGRYDIVSAISSRRARRLWRDAVVPGGCCRGVWCFAVDRMGRESLTMGRPWQQSGPFYFQRSAVAGRRSPAGGAGRRVPVGGRLPGGRLPGGAGRRSPAGGAGRRVPVGGRLPGGAGRRSPARRCRSAVACRRLPVGDAGRRSPAGGAGRRLPVRRQCTPGRRPHQKRQKTANSTMP